MPGSPSLVFVHGTGVRQASLDRTVAKLTAGVDRVAPGTAITVCNWGENVGSQLRLGGASVPAVRGGRSDPGAVGSDDIDAWAELERDFLVELRAEALTVPDAELPPGTAGPRPMLAGFRDAILSDAGVATAATDAGLSEDLAAAVGSVLNSAETERAAEAAAGDDRLTVLVSRAVVAAALQSADDRLEGTAPVHGDTRDNLVRAVAAACGRSPRAPFAAIGRLAWSALAARPIERRRRTLTDSASPLAGDVMRYLAAGQEMRDYVVDVVRSVAGPTVVVAHSLGGLISLEALHQSPLPGVATLLTVGSQSGLLHELGALPVLGADVDLKFGGSWVNVYDPRDLLAFLAEPVFGHRVTDHALDNRSPFPRAHSAYFDNPRFYDLLGRVLGQEQR